MIYHASSVVRGAQRAMIVVDLPFVPIKEIQKSYYLPLLKL